MILRRATVSDLPALLDVQERGAVTGLSNVFPQDAFPFPRTEVMERWKSEIADPEVRAYVSTDSNDSITGFAATRGNELFHFGTAVESWGTGLAQELHDAVVRELTNSLPPQTTHLRLGSSRKTNEPGGSTKSWIGYRQTYAPARRLNRIPYSSNTTVALT